MRKIIFTLLSSALFISSIGIAHARPCGSGSSGGCSWTCSGGNFNVTCSNPDGPDRCYVVSGGSSSEANCSDHSIINQRVIPGGLPGVIGYDNKKFNRKSKSKNQGLSISSKGSTVAQKRNNCRKYAKAARNAQNDNLRSRCGYKGGAWSTSFTRHYKWCMKTKKANAKRETLRRNIAIARCRQKVAHCRRYAKTAYYQQIANLKRKCGYKGHAWSTNHTTHYNWCMIVQTRISRSHQNKRNNALRKCQTRKKTLQLHR